MPRSKRAKVVHTSKVTKKGKQLQSRTYTRLHELLPKYPYLYVLYMENVRNAHLQEVRNLLSDSQLVLGKTKVMLHALTHLPPSLRSSLPHHQTLTSLLAPHITGSTALLFSPASPSRIRPLLSSLHPTSFARTGSICPHTFTLPAGRLYSLGGQIPSKDDVPVTVVQEVQLRKLGLPTVLNKGKVELENDFEVCREGEVLGSGAAKVLKAFAVQMAVFEIGVKAVWEGESGKVEVFEEGKRGGEEGMGDEEDEEGEGVMQV